MATFSALPGDLLLIVIEFAPRNALLSMVLVSKNLNRHATPYLYRYVHYWEKTPYPLERASFLDWPNNLHQMCCSPDRSTRIHNLNTFYQIITLHQGLRAHVHGASFESPVKSHDDRLIPRLIIALARSTKFIHAFQGMPCSASHHFKYLTSLEVDGGFLGPNKSRSEASRDKLYEVFCLPLLKTLTVTGVMWRGSFDAKTVHPERAGTSNVENLLLRDSGCGGLWFEGILSWPKALKSFRLELKIDDSGRFPHHTETFNAAKLSRALLPQATSLEGLHVYGAFGWHNFEISDPSSTVDLRHFTELRRVGLNLPSLMAYRTDLEMFSQNHPDVLQMFQVLPSALEELQIEMRDEFAPLVFFPSDPSWEVDLRTGELNSTMCEVFRKKMTNYPRLRRVAFFQCRDFAGADDLRSIPGCSEMLDYSIAAGVDVSWDSCEIPPLFSSWS